ncbi:MAG: rhodanese-like domain-containing protein [Pikeienuella sp.]
MAQTVRLLEDVPYFDMVINGKPIRIGRIQDTSNKLTGDFAKTSRACPPFCIHPIKAAEGVETFGEIEVLKFLNEEVQNGRGLLVDARIPDWYQKGTIPGSVNLPFTLVSQRDNPYFDRILVALGAKKFGAGWDFSGAQPLCLFCNGPWCDQSPRAINNLIRAGYPAEKLKYYRGGMQMWNLLGLTVETPKG